MTTSVTILPYSSAMSGNESSLEGSVNTPRGLQPEPHAQHEIPGNIVPSYVSSILIEKPAIPSYVHYCTAH